MRLCLCAFLLVAACVREAPQQAVRDSTSQSSIGTPAMTTNTDSLRLVLEAPAQVRLGDATRLVLRLRNAGATPIELYLRGREIAFDFVVRRADGTIAWQRLAGQIVPAIVQVKVLGPGDSLAFSDDWIVHPTREASLDPGRYTVEGLLLRDQPAPFRSDPVSIEVLSPAR